MQKIDNKIYQKIGGNIEFYEISGWKKFFLKKFFAKKKRNILFLNKLSKTTGANNSNTKLIWASRFKNFLAKNKDFAINQNDKFLIEDGFIRSIGLGCNFIPASSLCIDSNAMYYDGTKESDLENIIREICLNESQEDRIKKIIQTIIENNISKYNSHLLVKHKNSNDNYNSIIKQIKSARDDNKLNIQNSKKVIFVVGQVADDASITSYNSDIKDIVSLIKYIRAKNPRAFIIYRPHPDVMVKKRRGEQAHMMEISTLCDILVDCEIPITQILPEIDELHTISSLVGFEALVRGKQVFTYGMPFYAGWGLTQDYHKNDRRGVKKNIYELAYACLISYPLYYDYLNSSLCNIERILDIFTNYPQQLAKFENSNSLNRALSYLHKISLNY